MGGIYLVLDRSNIHIHGLLRSSKPAPFFVGAGVQTSPSEANEKTRATGQRLGDYALDVSQRCAQNGDTQSNVLWIVARVPL